MFFGLTNSPTTFQTMINTLFQKLIDEGNVTIYMDDIAIHTGPKDGETEEQHKQRHRKIIRQVLETLKENNLHLNPEKCTFKQDHLNFLGVHVVKGAVQMEQSKVNQVKKLDKATKRPRNTQIPGIHRVLSTFYQRVLADRLTPVRPNQTCNGLAVDREREQKL